MNKKRIYVLWPVWIAASALGCYLLFRMVSPDEPEARRRFLIRHAIVGLLFVAFSFIIETVGVNSGLWYNKTSMFEFGRFRVSVEEVPIEFFAGIFWIMLFNTFESKEHKLVFFLTSTGTISYIIALMVHAGFLIHDKWYNIGWTYLYWVANLGFLVFCDSLVSRKFPAEVVESQ